MAEDSKGAVIASIVANVAIATTKFIVAAITRSTAMFAEGVHSLADCFDGGLLLLGGHRARRPPDTAHPFGHGRELFFWAFVVAVVFFALGAGFTVYEGVRHALHPEPIGDPTWNYVVLAVATVFDGGSFVIGFRRFRRAARGRSYWRTFRESKDPSLFSVVLEDTADLLGLALAFGGVYLSRALHMPALDGVASIAIGLVLGAIAVLLLVETHGLLVGEAAAPGLVRALRESLARDDAVVRVESPLTAQVGPSSVVAAVRVGFRPELAVSDVARRIQELDRRVRGDIPELARLFIEVVPAGEGDASDDGPASA